MPNIDGDNRSYIVALQQHQTDVEDVIRQGTTVVRSVSQFRSLDASLRQESCKEVVQVVVFPSTINQQSLQEYMQTILQMPKVIHSDALAVFLTVVDNSTEEHSTLQCVQYLLPGIQSPTYEPIPRFGSYEQTIDTILPGWWLVWYLQSDAIVDFEVVATGTDGVQELVHQETCEQDCCFGSYRVLSEPTRAVLKVRGRAIFFTGASKVFVDSAAIPHEAFVAACTAANDANAAAEKRRHAPLLSLILDSDQVNVCIHVWKDENKQAVSEELTETPMLYHVDQLTTLSDQVVSSEQQANELTSARDDLRKELANSQTLVKKMKQNLEMAASERRVWNVVRSELQSELSRLSREVETERNDKTRAVADLQEARQELREISGQLRLVELQGNTSSNTNWTKSQEEELKQARRKLESDLQTEKSRSEKLQQSIDKIENSAEERVTRATNEAHEARMAQRILENQVRQLEEDKRRVRAHDLAPNPESPTCLLRTLDPKVAYFQHPEPRLNEQLSTLRDRHRKLSSLFAQNPNNSKNLEILGMLEKAIHEIVSKT